MKIAIAFCMDGSNPIPIPAASQVSISQAGFSYLKEILTHLGTIDDRLFQSRKRFSFG
ncbi:hypothetical protein [Scytonema sp. NUACC21]